MAAGKGGTGVLVVRDCAAWIKSLQAKKMILHTRRNDLNDQVGNPDKLAQNILSVDWNFILQDGVTHMAICQMGH